LTCRFGNDTFFITAGTITSSSQIVCLSPKQNVGTFQVELLAQSVSICRIMVFEIINLPGLRSISPSVGSLNGRGVVLVVGQHFQLDNMTCAFGNQSSVYSTVLSSTLLRCTTPILARSEVVERNVAVRLQYSGTVLEHSSADFLIAEEAMVQSLAPSTSEQSPLAVTIIGSNFRPTVDLACKWGASATVMAKYASSTMVHCKRAVLQEGNYTVKVSVNGVDFSNQKVEFRIVSASVRIVEVIPSTGPLHGGYQVRVVVRGVIPRERMRCFIGTGSAVAWVVHDAEVLCTVPKGVEGRQPVGLSVGSSADSQSSVIFEYYAGSKAKVSSVVPRTGWTEGGTKVSVVGVDFRVLDGLCDFGGQLVPAMEGTSSTLVVCESPSFPAGYVGVDVLGQDGAMTNSQLSFRYHAAARVRSVFPSSVQAGVVSWITITGDNFLDTPHLSCRFGETISLCRFVDIEHAVCFVPALSQPSVSLSVSNNGVDFAFGNVSFQHRSPMQVYGVTPSAGWVSGGTVMTVLGSSFQPPLDCVFDSKERVEAFVLSSSRVRCTSPERASDGTVMISLSRRQDPEGILAGASEVYEFLPEAGIAGLVPSSGPASGGTAVVVRGSNLGWERVWCWIGSRRNVSGRAVSSTIVLCITPPSSSLGTARVEVSPNGQDFTRGGLRFEYEGDVTLVDVIPSQGSELGGTVVTGVGSGFPLSLMFRFGSDEDGLVPVLRLSSSRVTCVTPRHAVGNTSIRVSKDGAGEWGSGLNFRFVSAFMVQYVRPSWGTKDGGHGVTVTGSGFDKLTEPKCLFGGIAVVAQLITPSEISCILPTHSAGPVKMTVCNEQRHRCAQDSLSFVYVDHMSVMGLRPSSGPVSGGTDVSVVGDGFTKDFLTCMFGDEGVAAGFESSSVVVCRSPGHAAGVVSLDMQSRLGVASRSSAAFLFFDEPVVLRAAPCSGSGIGGTLITVFGLNFVPLDSAACLFGKTSVDATVLSSTALMCVTPWSAAAGEVVVRISMNGVDYPRHGVDFSFIASAAVISIMPSFGSLSAGSEVSVIGIHFQLKPELRCRLDGTSTNVSFVSSSVLVCHAVGWRPGSTMLTVESQDGGEVIGKKEFVFVEDMETDAVTPSVVPVEGGSVVTVSGSYFVKNATICKFGEVGSIFADVVSSSQLRCVTLGVKSPGMASLEITGTAWSVDRTRCCRQDLLFVSRATLLGIWPSVGSVAGGTLVMVGLIGPMGGDPFCRFGDEIVEGLQITSTSMSCLSPMRRNPLNTSIRISADGVYFSREEAEFVFEDFGVVVSMSPRRGPVTGATPVVIGARGLKAVAALRCLIGDDIVAPFSVDDKSVTCITPSHAKGAVRIHLMSGVESLSGGSGLTYLYEEVPRIVGIHPSFGALDGSTLVRVRGQHFEGRDATCMFGNASARATVMSSSMLQCVSPRSNLEELCKFDVSFSGTE
jgi:hypothetical protein